MNEPGAPAGGPQVWYGDSPAITLGHVIGFNEFPSTASAQFRIYTPDSRMRVKITVLFLKDAPDATTPVTGLGATLYLGEEEHDRSGKRGQDLLCTDILRDVAGNVIHQSAPLAIPEDVGLIGFTMEFVTAADSVLGIFTTTNGPGPDGHWVLQVRYQPDGQRLCDQDWEWVKRKCHATLVGGTFAI